MEMEELVQKIKQCQDEVKKTIRSEILQRNEDTINFIEECVVNQTMLNLYHQVFFGGSERKARSTKDQLEEVLQFFREARQATDADSSSECDPQLKEIMNLCDEPEKRSSFSERSQRMQKILNRIDELYKKHDAKKERQSTEIRERSQKILNLIDELQKNVLNKRSTKLRDGATVGRGRTNLELARHASRRLQVSRY